MLGHCHSSWESRFPRSLLNPIPGQTPLLQFRIYFECEGLAGSPGGSSSEIKMGKARRREGRKKASGEMPPALLAEMVSYPGRGALKAGGRAWKDWGGGSGSRQPKRQPQGPRISFPTRSPHTVPGARRRLSADWRQIAVTEVWRACAAAARILARTPTPKRWKGRNYTPQQAVRPHAPRRPRSPPATAPRPWPSLPRRARASRMRTASPRHVGSV